VFKISTNGALTTLYAFATVTDANGDPLDGANPSAALVQGSDGNFYGTTQCGGTMKENIYDASRYGYGTVFKISTNGALTTLYLFTGGNDGAYPAAELVQASDGYLYGATQPWDRTGVCTLCFPIPGTVFKISTNGVLTTLHTFSGDEGTAGLVQGSDGYFYGTAYGGGGTYSYWGTVFRVGTNGVFTSLYSFTGGDDGFNPNGLVQGSDGNFYGTTADGGAYTTQYGQSYGTVFRLAIVPDPQLTLIPSGPYMILTWPTNSGAFSYAGYTLQSTPSLGPSAVWTPVCPGAVIIGDQNIAISTISASQQFYRLSEPLP
jgi:uncharacterized repeat protein (TIGR03803 family)